jgi:hypothetical protein
VRRAQFHPTTAISETRASRRKLGAPSRAALAGLAACAVGLASAGASIATTSPGQHVDAVVLIQAKGITVGDDARLPRGVNVTFFVKNLTRSPKNFRFLGKHTKVILPGKQAKLTVTLIRRGVFPYLSTVHPSKVLRGLFIVY